ncbi:MAG TPA: hypothetical protein VLT89_05465, partial [Usitatibacter sp.]|nr:hypothetical protein [Usitatibacter sp.]
EADAASAERLRAESAALEAARVAAQRSEEAVRAHEARERAAREALALAQARADAEAKAADAQLAQERADRSAATLAEQRARADAAALESERRRVESARTALEAARARESAEAEARRLAGERAQAADDLGQLRAQLRALWTERAKRRAAFGLRAGLAVAGLAFILYIAVMPGGVPAPQPHPVEGTTLKLDYRLDTSRLVR